MAETCGACGFPLPAQARFCPRCGTPVAGGNRAGERKLVTVLFADLVGSTELSRALDPERTREVLNAFFDAVAAEMSSARGQVEKFIGDAVMAVFGLPRVHEDDALRAARAGLAVVAHTERLSREMGLRPALRVRVGIESGEAATGDGPAGQRLVTGAVVNAAARLQSAAAPGEVLVGDTTRLLLGDAASVGATRHVDAKGFAGGITGHPVVALARRSVRRTIPLVGRRTELGLLQHTLDRVTATGHPHLFTVLGEAGMGKSRLLEEFVALLPADVTTLLGRADVEGGMSTLGPLAEMLRGFAGIGEGGDPDDVVRRLESTIATAAAVDDAGTLARRLATSLRMVQDGGVVDEAMQVQDAQRAFTTLVTSLGVRRPVAVVVDDAHLARTPVLDLVERLATRTRGTPARAVVLVAGRHELVEERPTWGGSARNHVLVRLEPLTVAESADLAREAGGARLGEGTPHRIAARAGGNPFFIVETTGMLLDAAPGDVDTAALPPTVQAVVAARLDRLPAALRDLVHRAAVFHDTFDLDQLALVDGADAEGLATLEEAEILTAEDRPPRWRFRHRIVQEVAYAGLSKRERLRLHLAVADGFAAAGRPGVPDHLERAALASLDLDPADRTVPDRAVDALVMAGDRARRRMESRRAVDRYRRALALAGASEGWGAREGRALVGIGEARYWLAEYARASEALEQAERLGLAVGDDWTLAVALRFLGDIVLNVDADIDRAEALHERSLEAAERLGDAGTISRSLLFAGWVPWSRDDCTAAEAMWERALALTRDTGDRWVEARALIGLSVSCSERNDVVTAAARAEEALAVARALGDQFSTAVAMIQLGRTIEERGRPEEAMGLFTEAAAIFEETGARWEHADALYARGHAYERMERLDDAERDLRAAVRMSEELGARTLGGWSARALGRVRRRRNERQAPVSEPAGDVPR